jgi:hypothetical protein
MRAIMPAWYWVVNGTKGGVIPIWDASTPSELGASGQRFDRDLSANPDLDV